MTSRDSTVDKGRCPLSHTLSKHELCYAENQLDAQLTNLPQLPDKDSLSLA
jgi:hypothetical protein